MHTLCLACKDRHPQGWYVSTKRRLVEPSNYCDRCAKLYHPNQVFRTENQALSQLARWILEEAVHVQ